MISPDTIQQVIGRIDIIDIIGEFVRLKRRGANYIGLCPFHDERTPSFTVSPTKEIYKCFGCGRSGNTITFLMEHEKYSYVEAIRWLAKKYGIEIEETEVSPEYKQQLQTAESLHAINNFAQKFFTERLFHSEEGQSIGLSYLKERGFRENIISTFDLGYCPSDNSFSNAAIKNQFNKDLLVKSGLVVSRDGILKDNYHERIIFPIHNQTGKIIGFGARILQSNPKAPKYINTPENEIYNKSKVLYGLWQARQHIGKKNECILVEGYTDVIQLHQAGVENAVASGGTSLTRDQLRLIKKITPNLTILYDGDSAGVAATMRGLNLALEEGLTVKIVTLPSPEDPDSYIKKFGGATFESYLLDHKQDFILFQLDIALKEAGGDSTKKAAAVKMIADSLAKLIRPEDFTLQQDYVKKVAVKLGIEEAGLLNLINNIIRENLSNEQKKFLNKPSDKSDLLQSNSTENTTEPTDPSVEALFNSDKFHERAMVRCLLEYGRKEWDKQKSVAAYLLEEFEIEELIRDPILAKIVENYRHLYQSGEKPDAKYFLYNDNPEISNMVASLLAFPYEISTGWHEKFKQDILNRDDQYISDINSTLRYVELKRVRSQILENEKALQNNPKENKLTVLLETHRYLKSLELELAKQVGMAIMK